MSSSQHVSPLGSYRGSSPAMDRRGWNLALSFQEVFTAIVRLRSRKQDVPNAEVFRTQMKQALRAAEQEAVSRGYVAEDVHRAIFAIVAFLDESVLSSRNPAFAEWPRLPLQAELFGHQLAGEVVFQELQKGTDPKQIVEILSTDPAFQSRQFGILDLQGRRAGHSGLTNGYVSQDLQGQVPGTEIFYSIQGNILRPGEVVPNAVQAFLKTQGAITDRVMAAMEAADGSGGDSRCTCPPWPADGSKPPIPCDGKTAHVAYILMAEKNDSSGDSHNNGKYAMYITVSQPGPDHGPNTIKAGENLNPVKTLRVRYDAWRKAQPASFK